MQKSITKISLGLTAVVVAFSAWLLVSPMRVQAAACAAPSSDLGTATLTVSVPASGSYRVWSRVMAPDTTNNSYSLEVDGTNCYVVADNQLAANTWSWVDYQSGSTGSKINVNLSAGTHTLKLIGREANVAVDRVILASDTACVPSGTGSNCTVDVDQTPPAVSLTSPAANDVVFGEVKFAATASDASGISKVDFYVDGVLKNSDNTSPYAYNWDSTTVSNGAHTVSARAYDKVGNINSDTANVTVKNGDIQPPSVPSGVNATAPSPTTVDVTWNASTDNVAVTGYWVQRNNVTLAQVGNATSYHDATAVAGTTYSYRVIAFDAAGNMSAASAAKSVTTPKPPVADTQPPTTPTGLSATAVSQSQVNLKWTISKDNVGVAKYHIYRSSGTDRAEKIASVTTSSFGDSGLSAGTTYTYYVIAEDAAGNSSTASGTASATTAKPPTTNKKKGSIKGVVRDDRGKRFSGAHVTIWVNGHKQLYHTKDNGSYRIPRLPAGMYVVTYSSHDNEFYPQTYHLKVQPGQANTKNVSLKYKD